MLPLTQDLLFFDLEATGLNLTRDRIVQIAMIKCFADGRPRQELELKVNPTVPISDEARAIHGLSNDDLKDEPTFQEVAQRIYDFIGDADLAGYNSNRFDVPMLQEEFYRAGIYFDTNSRKLIDAQHVFYQMEPRTLSAALQFYAGKEMENAHDALADVRATVDVLEGQLSKYAGRSIEKEDGSTVQPFADMNALANFCRDDRFLDATRRIKRGPDGTPVFNFGKHAGKAVADVFTKEPSYLKWILDKDFTTEVKALVRAIDEERRKVK